MSDFWPSDLEVSDTSSPHEILLEAQDEWKLRSEGMLTLVIQEAKSTSGNSILIVHCKHVPSSRTITLFSVVHRPGSPYPAKIQPRDVDLPDILKKSYYRPGLTDPLVTGIKGETVNNKWVCDTPNDFRKELRNVMNLGTVKGEIQSLISRGGSAAPNSTIVEEKEDTSGSEATDLNPDDPSG